MNLERLLNMVIRQVMRTLVNKGIGAGFIAVSKRKGAKDGSQNNDPEAQQAAKLAAKRARQAAKIGPRL